MANNQTVSIIIPLYNAEKYIEETLLSVDAQDYPDKEVIIVDDCSMDSSAEIVKRMQSNMPYIRYHKLEHNSGVAIARNTAIKLAKGRYIAFVDSDDVWKQGKLTQQLQLFDKHTGCPFTYTAIDYIDEESNSLKSKRSLKEEVSYNYILRNTVIATSTVIIDRQVVPEIVMPNRRSAEDYSLWLSILKKYGNAYGINEALTSYRISSTSVSSNRAGEVKFFYDVQVNDLHINKVYATFNTVCYILNAIKKHYF